MSRDYAGTPTLTRASDYAIGHSIRESGAAPDHGGMDRWAKNANSIYAAWSPTLAGWECWNADGTHPLAFANPALATMYALRFRCPADTIHPDAGILLDAFACGGGVATSGVVQLRTVNGADSASVAIPFGLSYGWVSTAAVATGVDGTGREIAIVECNRDAGANDVLLRHVHVYYTPYTGGAGLLPSGVEASGFVAHDLAQYDADSPLSAGAAQELHDSHVLLRGMFPWPVGAWLCDCRAVGDPKSMGGGTTSAVYVLVARIPYWRRKGEGVTTLSYSILGETDPPGIGGAGGKAKIKVRVGQSDPFEETADLTLPTSTDPEDAADWLDGTLDISSAPEGLLNPPIWVEAYVKSNVAGDGSGLYSVCIQEEPA